jgi:hypothetical protein
MVDANVRLAGKLLAGALAIVTLAVMVPCLFQQTPDGEARPSATPAAIQTTQPTILHAAEGLEDTPSPLSDGQAAPASLERAVTNEDRRSAFVPAPLASEDMRR